MKTDYDENGQEYCICEGCGGRIKGSIYFHGDDDDAYCSIECMVENREVVLDDEICEMSEEDVLISDEDICPRRYK